MDCDDIVVGSGLSALGTVLGLAVGLRVLVLCGPATGQFSYYDARRTVPSAYLGLGGLGNDWHGVIPTGWRSNFGGGDDAGFRALFKYFYESADLNAHLGAPWLFVPWRPIRPKREFARLARNRADRLTLIRTTAQRFKFNETGVEVTADGVSYRARRLWIAAGPLHTPALLERSLGPNLARGLASDHVVAYVGQVDGLPAPKIAHAWRGTFFPAYLGEFVDALYTLRPARFAFREIDYGIEQRAVFGMPTGSALAKIARRMSPGLLAEAFYNRFGLFPDADRYSVYAQVLVRDAYAMDLQRSTLCVQNRLVSAAVGSARVNPPFEGVRLSKRPETILPGIHLHHTVDLEALRRSGVGASGSPVHVVDASVAREVGPEHHTFKIMLCAHDRAREATAR